MRNSEKSSTKPLVYERRVTFEGHEVVLSQLQRGMRSRSLPLTEEEIKLLPAQAIINLGEDVGEGRKKVNFWEPVLQNVKVVMDGNELRIFHTLRGPVMGKIQRETATDVVLYSPCYIEPNIQAGKVHFLPVAFAGFLFRLFKTHCIGESVPDTEIVQAYPRFIKLNEEGEYKLRTKGAYHHIEADIDPEARVPSIELVPNIREQHEGIMPTSDTREIAAIAQARAMKQVATQPENSEEGVTPSVAEEKTAS